MHFWVDIYSDGLTFYWLKFFQVIVKGTIFHKLRPDSSAYSLEETKFNGWVKVVVLKSLSMKFYFNKKNAKSGEQTWNKKVHFLLLCSQAFNSYLLKDQNLHRVLIAHVHCLLDFYRWFDLDLALLLLIVTTFSGRCLTILCRYFIVSHFLWVHPSFLCPFLEVFGHIAFFSLFFHDHFGRW